MLCCAPVPGGGGPSLFSAAQDLHRFQRHHPAPVHVPRHPARASTSAQKAELFAAAGPNSVREARQLVARPPSRGRSLWAVRSER